MPSPRTPASRWWWHRRSARTRRWRRPDPAAYNAYLERLGAAAGIEIGSYADLLRALEQRHGYFHEQGCRLSDHGIEEIYADPFTQAAAAAVFAKVRAGTPLERAELRLLQSALLYELAVMDAGRGWTQQYHLGALRGLNTRLGTALGPDTGFDSMGDRAWRGVPGSTATGVSPRPSFITSTRPTTTWWLR